jgi:phosphoribosylglycinamide formyltransferase-1
MQAVIEACEAGSLRASPAVLISNNRAAEAIERAKRHGVPTYVLNSVTHPAAEDLDRAMLDALLAHGVDIVLLAGFMKKVGPKVLVAYAGRVLNIHPGLLPMYGGQGMFGAHVHSAVLAAGEKVSGVSIHLTDGEYDHGQVIAQTEVPVLEGDTVESLAARVLEKEHEFLVETLRLICSGILTLPSQP